MIFPWVRGGNIAKSARVAITTGYIDDGLFMDYDAAYDLVSLYRGSGMYVEVGILNIQCLFGRECLFCSFSRTGISSCSFPLGRF